MVGRVVVVVVVELPRWKPRPGSGWDSGGVATFFGDIIENALAQVAGVRGVIQAIGFFLQVDALNRARHGYTPRCWVAACRTASSCSSKRFTGAALKDVRMHLVIGGVIQTGVNFADTTTVRPTAARTPRRASAAPGSGRVLGASDSS